MAILNCSHLACGHKGLFGAASAPQVDAARAPVNAARAPVNYGRRDFLTGALTAGAGLAGLSVLGGCVTLVQPGGAADTMIVNAKIATLDRRRPQAAALAVRGGTIIAIGSEADLASWRGPETVIIDAGGRTVVPGLNDAHTHFIRGGLTYSAELRWDGVPSIGI